MPIPYIQKIGEGGYGTVYRSFWGGRRVAAKTFRCSEFLSNKGAIEQEIKLLRTLNYKHIIQFYGALYEPSVGSGLVLIMELAEGGSLQRAIEKGILEDWDVKKRISQEIANGLAYIHHKKVLHRDLKSANVLLTRCLEVKLCDFGLALIKKSSLTHVTDQVRGTIRWLAPELLGRHSRYSTKSDMYALGMVMWEMAANCVQPFKDQENNAVVGNLVLNGEREYLPNDTPEDYSQWVKRCWEHEPSKRPEAKECALVVESDDERGSVVSFGSDPEYESDHETGADADGCSSGTELVASSKLSVGLPMSPDTTNSSVWSFSFINSWPEELPTTRLGVLIQKADNNNIEAQVELARMYADGDGVDKDGSEAFFWYLRAARKGHVVAQRNLAACFSSRDTLQCHVEACSWYRKAAEQGDAESQFQLGLMHELGETIPKDFAEARVWYQMAAGQGHPEAGERLALLAITGENDKPSTSESQQGSEQIPSSEALLVQSIIDKIDRASAGVKYFKTQSTFLRQKCQSIGRHQNIDTLAGQRGQFLIKFLKEVLEFMHTLGTSGLILQFFDTSEIKNKFAYFNQEVSAWSNGPPDTLDPSMIAEDEKAFDDKKATVVRHQDVASKIYKGGRVKVDLDKFAIDPSKVQMGAKIGTFSFGDVYEGTIGSSPVHIKLLGADLDLTFKEAIKRGILLNRYLMACDNIIRLLYISGSRMIVMEAATYPSIHNMFKEGIKLERQEKVAFVCKVAAAVSYIHSCGIIHRDIRGTNVPVNRTEDGALEPKLGGLESSRDVSSLSLIVSPVSAWDAPEKMRYGTSMSTDIYAFGVFMWEMSMQQQPHELLSIDELATMESGNISKEYTDLMQKCFEPEPENRPQMRDLALALAALT